MASLSYLSLDINSSETGIQIDANTDQGKWTHNYYNLALL